MTDHRVTDHSYGHPGIPIYHIETNSWAFPVDKEHKICAAQIQDTQECVPPSTSHEAEDRSDSSVVAQAQMRWLLRSHPETFPANQTISAVLKAPSPSASTFPIHEGCLLSSARAKDIDRVSGSRRPIIIAFPSGASGQILHLLRPRPETRGWKNQSEARLKLLDPNSIEHGYWNGTGGPIRQIASAEENGLKPGPWLGVRQDTVVTIFEPIYGMLRGSRGLALSRAEKTPSSLLHPNPVVTLPVDRTASRFHVDFSFNPFYPRQFAVIDDLGRWSIWNMENLHDKGSTRILSPGRRGELSEASVQYGSDLKESSHPEHFDGWHKVMWACDVDTIVVCSRRCIAVFNVKSNPERLQSPDFLPVKSAEWIVDAVRSPAHPDQVFVLTTAQIYWMKVIPAGDEDQSVKVLQSYRHAGDANAETMKLTVVNGDSISVAIAFPKIPLVKLYLFQAESSPTLSCQGSLELKAIRVDDTVSPRAMCFLPCIYMPGESPRNNSGMSQPQKDIEFYQVWMLTPNLRLLTAIYAVQRLQQRQELGKIQAPDRKIKHSSRGRGARIIEDEDDFIVPDDFAANENVVLAEDGQIFKTNDGRNEIRYRVDWRTIYKHAFSIDRPPTDLLEDIQSMRDIAAKVTDNVKRGLEEDTLPMKTFADMVGLTRSSGELEEGALILRDLVASLKLGHQDPESASNLVLSNLTACPRTQDLAGTNLQDIDLFRVHGKLVSYWITSLPMEVPRPARLAKFKIIRQLGVELSLSALGISLQDKASIATIATSALGDKAQERAQSENPHETITRDSSPAIFSSQSHLAAGADMYSSLITPSRTPSIYSHATSAASELKEDPAVSRLRQYAVSIKARPDMGKSTLLSHWPAQPGIDPSTYSYGAMQKQAAADDGGTESEYKSRKEEARRRRRMERFLRQERARASGSVAPSVSQPMVVLPSGSQPEARNYTYSSQVADELPMTQPDRGTFGSRSTSKEKKQKKHRKAGF